VPYKKDRERQGRLAALESIRESAVEMGILVDAQANARSAIRRILSFAGVKEIAFEPIT